MRSVTSPLAYTVSLVLASACVSPGRVVPVVPVTEGTTAGGISYDVRGSGPTVVLIHGGIIDRRMWDEEAREWSDDFRVVRYDLRGHGKSPDITGSFSAIDDLLAVLDAVGAARAHLVGLSLGSRVALDFTLEHPARVDRLVLAGPFPSGAAVTEAPPGLDSLMAAAQRGDVDRAAALAAGMPAFAAPPAKAAWVRGLVMDNARLFRQSATAERQLTPPSVQRLREVRAPTLVILGSREVRDILVAADTLASGIAGARKVVVPDAGHLVNVWKPAEFREAVERFLKGDG